MIGVIRIILKNVYIVSNERDDIQTICSTYV